MGKEEKDVARHDDSGAERPGPLLRAELRHGLSITKGGGPCTPAPTWKLQEVEAVPSRARLDAEASGNRCRVIRRHQRSRRPLVLFPATVTSGTKTAVSARKLGADLWEAQESRQRSRMSRKGTRSPHFKGERLLAELSDLSPLVPHEPESAGSLRRHLLEPWIQHRKSTRGRDHPLQPVSSACHSNSMEVAAYNLAATPTSSLDPKRRPGCKFKTSTELLKVLNRIWSLEEQHASSAKAVKTLRSELEHGQARIQKLLKDKQSYRHKVDELVKQIAEDKLLRESNEEERICAAVQSIRDELEEERRLRRQSEILHKKFAKELCDVKLACSRASRDLERVKTAQRSIQHLCDELAMGIRDYEEEVRELKRGSDRGYDVRCDRPVLHISEAWIDERLQMKVAEAQGDDSSMNMILNRLMCEVESFLEARQTNFPVVNDFKDAQRLRHTLESVHTDEAVPGPQDVDEIESPASNLRCFKSPMETSVTETHGSYKIDGTQSVKKLDEARKSGLTRKTMKPSERPKCHSTSISQVKLKAHAQSCKKGKIPFIKRVQGAHSRNLSTDDQGDGQVDVVLPLISENGVQESGEHMNATRDCVQRCSEPELDQVCRVQSEDVHVDDSCNSSTWRAQSLTVDGDDVSDDLRGLPIPAQKWGDHYITAHSGVTDFLPESPDGTRENSTLKAKLLEARLEVLHARPRASRGSPIVG